MNVRKTIRLELSPAEVAHNLIAHLGLPEDANVRFHVAKVDMQSGGGIGDRPIWEHHVQGVEITYVILKAAIEK